MRLDEMRSCGRNPPFLGIIGSCLRLCGGHTLIASVKAYDQGLKRAVLDYHVLIVLRDESVKCAENLAGITNPFSFEFITITGTIDETELGTVMRSLGHQPSDEEIQDMINEVC
jgi:hypothetical protein